MTQNCWSQSAIRNYWSIQMSHGQFLLTRHSRQCLQVVGDMSRVSAGEFTGHHKNTTATFTIGVEKNPLWKMLQAGWFTACLGSGVCGSRGMFEGQLGLARVWRQLEPVDNMRWAGKLVVCVCCILLNREWEPAQCHACMCTRVHVCRDACVFKH